MADSEGYVVRYRYLLVYVDSVNIHRVVGVFATPAAAFEEAAQRTFAEWYVQVELYTTLVP
jgi:hypothetical protein